jgi:hypothetical protein
MSNLYLLTHSALSKKWMRYFKRAAPVRTEGLTQCPTNYSTTLIFQCAIAAQNTSSPNTMISPAHHYSNFLKIQVPQIDDRTTNQKVGSSTHSGRAPFFPSENKTLRSFGPLNFWPVYCTPAGILPLYCKISTELLAGNCRTNAMTVLHDTCHGISPAGETG